VAFSFASKQRNYVAYVAETKDKAMLKKVMTVLAWSVTSIGLGAILGALIWTLFMVLQGKLSDAIAGQVEDGIGQLEGLMALGIMVGCPVGLLYGITRLARAR
jgi:hypothetical protein